MLLAASLLPWVAEVGLVLDTCGAIVLTYGLIMSREQALHLGVPRYAGSTDDENLNLPQVEDLVKQSRNAKLGLVLLCVGFLLQAVGNWP